MLPSESHRFSLVKPTVFEIAVAAVILAVVLLISLFDAIAARLGAAESLPAIMLVMTVTTQSFLQWLDSFSATSDIVLFTLWGSFGILAFVLLQAIRNATGNLFFMVNFSSRRYRHPSGFSTQRYWLHVALTGLEIFSGIIVACSLLFIIFGMVLPTASAYFRAALSGHTGALQPVLQGIGFSLLGLGFTYGLIVVGRFLWYRHVIIPE